MTTATAAAPAAPAAAAPASAAPAPGSDAAGVAAAAALNAAPAAGTTADLLIGGVEEAKADAAAPAAPDTGIVAVEYNPTGDAGLDLALNFVGKLGFAPTDPAMKAAEAGDFGLMKAKLAALGDKAKGYEQYIALAERAHAETTSKASAKTAKDVETIRAAVGGAENWSQISKWAAANAEPHEKAEVNAALKQGGVAAKAMALWLQQQYNKAGGTTVTPAEAVRPNAAAKPAASGGALDAKTYATEVQKLRASMGYKFENSPQYAALQARRVAGQNSGL